MQCECLIHNWQLYQSVSLSAMTTTPSQPSSVAIRMSAKEDYGRRAVAGIRYDSLIQTHAVYTDKLYNSINYI